MLIVMSSRATSAEVEAVVQRVRDSGLRPELSVGAERTVIGVVGSNPHPYRDAFTQLRGVREIVPDMTRESDRASGSLASQKCTVEFNDMPWSSRLLRPRTVE